MKLFSFVIGFAVASSALTVKAEDTYSFYPTQKRNLVRMTPMIPDNMGFIDVLNPIKDQGSIATCASHGMMALLENQMYNERGITLNLSERFHLYSTYINTSNMGTDPTVITHFPNIIAEMGLMPGPLYPYSEVLPNASRFTQDAAQGLHTAGSDDFLDTKIAKLTDMKERSDLLQEKIYLGALPKGPYPISLPVRATNIIKGSIIPEVEDRTVPGKAKVVPCFSDRAEDTMLTVTPKEYLNMCFDFKPEQYFGCKIDFENSADKVAQGRQIQEICKDIPKFASEITQSTFARRQSLLNLTVRLLQQKQAVFIGVKSPAQGQTLSVWYNKLAPGAGHAVVAVGYLTADELKEKTHHAIGLLKDGTFDALSKSLDATLIAMGNIKEVSYTILPEDNAEAIYNKRLSSNLAKVILREGGVLFFRNSWGAKLDTLDIGAGGYQSMTFDYFLQNSSLVLSKQKKSMTDIQWSPGPIVCPADSQAISTRNLINSSEGFDLTSQVTENQTILENVCGQLIKN